MPSMSLIFMEINAHRIPAFISAEEMLFTKVQGEYQEDVGENMQDKTDTTQYKSTKDKALA